MNKLIHFTARMNSKSQIITASTRLSAISRHMSSSASNMASPTSPPASSTSDLVQFQSQGSARVYRLNRPKARNALNMEMIQSLSKKVKAWRDSDLCHLIVGTGDDVAFCAGGDVKTIVQGREAGHDEGLAFFKDEFELNWLLGRLGKPYVAIIDGITMGGGAGLSLPAPLRVATKRTIFAMPETKIGYAPDVGANYYLSQLDGEIGAWLAVTGQEVWGRAVYELGIATHYVDPSSIPGLIHQITELTKPSLSTLSSLIASYAPSPPPTSTPPSSRASPEGPSPITGDIRAFLDQTFKYESVAEVYAALEAAEGNEKLSPEVKEWAKVQKGIMDERSPTGMAVALMNFHQIKKAKRLQMAIQNDMLMATGFTGKNRPTDDFSTGVTHLLVSKAKGRPSWNPSSITDTSVSPASIKRDFFNSSTPHLSDAPQLELYPESSSRKGRDSTWGLFRKYGLPSEEEVRAWVNGEAPGSGAFKITEKELIDSLIGESGVHGVGQREYEAIEKVKSIVNKYCNKDAEGYLAWK